ncbi:MAG: 4-hydroxythreonine-4-phosphate dehydrogenase [Campylobacterota bacterium]|nr:4-hydroxythreonine-4-phosphate dehydrogenase [Campylobacterota bacterium]
MREKIAISIGDLNGIGIELIIKNHHRICKICQPIYCINDTMLNRATTLLQSNLPKNMKLHQTKGKFAIKPGKISKKSGLYSYHSFYDAVQLCTQKEVSAMVTLPIHKKAWEKAAIHYVGHTDALRDIFDKHAIMMLGCKKLFVALYTEHIALKKVPAQIKKSKLLSFLLDFYNCVHYDKIGVLGLNPHASDNGVLGNEELDIHAAIQDANKILGKNIFEGPLVPDIAFTPNVRKEYKYLVAMYHDQGLAPLKALYFDESINVSLNLPIVRTSVDHGTAFNLAYQNSSQLSSKSYINAVQEAITLCQNTVN